MLQFTSCRLVLKHCVTTPCGTVLLSYITTPLCYFTTPCVTLLHYKILCYCVLHYNIMC